MAAQTFANTTNLDAKVNPSGGGAATKSSNLVPNTQAAPPPSQAPQPQSQYDPNSVNEYDPMFPGANQTPQGMPNPIQEISALNTGTNPTLPTQQTPMPTQPSPSIQKAVPANTHNAPQPVPAPKPSGLGIKTPQQPTYGLGITPTPPKPPSPSKPTPYKASVPVKIPRNVSY